MLTAVLPHTAATFARAIVMPNLVPPVTDVAGAVAYRGRILDALPEGARFEPLMTCYLTDTTDVDEIRRGFGERAFVAAKLYPAGATTNSESGVTNIDRIAKVLEAMAAIDMPLLVHGEVTDPAIDVFDREAVFIDRVLDPLRRRLPELRVVFEHVTTSDAVDYVVSQKEGLAATITPHHLVLNRNALFDGGLRPHMYCLPVAKREAHRVALRAAATSGDVRFFLGTDSAPHAIGDKERDCGCAGIFCAPTAMATYARVFEEEGALDRLEAFASCNGPAFYGLPPNEDRIELCHDPSSVDDWPDVAVDDQAVRVFMPETARHWRVTTVGVPAAAG